MVPARKNRCGRCWTQLLPTASPHWWPPPTRHRAWRSFHRSATSATWMQRRPIVNSRGMDCGCTPGAELLYNPMLRDAARENGLPTLAGTDWVLMEFLPQTSAKELENGLEEVAVCGYSILMAHVERYRCLESRGLLEKLKARYPVACQMNGSTVLEPGSFWKRRRVERWLSSGVIDVVASDAHNTTSRPVNLREAYQKLKLTFGEETADRLTGRSGLWKEFRDALAQQKTT